MSSVTDEPVELKHLREIVDSFEVEEPEAKYFVEGDQEELARRMGELFWSTPTQAAAIFLYAYGALFGLPALTREALDRQPGRFSLEQLPHTIATTSGFILDAFGFDRRMNRPREVIYWPAPTIRSVHGQRVDSAGGVKKERISDIAMCYFGTHIARAAETLCPSSDDSDPEFKRWCAIHFDYVGSFFRTAGYHFPVERSRADVYCEEVDQLLAGEEYVDLWSNLLHAAGELEVELTASELRDFLLPNSQAIFAQAEVCISG